MDEYKPGQQLAFGKNLAQFEILDGTLFVKCDSEEVASTVRDAVSTMSVDTMFFESSIPDNLPVVGVVCSDYGLVLKALKQACKMFMPSMWMTCQRRRS